MNLFFVRYIITLDGFRDSRSEFIPASSESKLRQQLGQNENIEIGECRKVRELRPA